MHLTELKNTPVSDLVKLGEEQMVSFLLLTVPTLQAPMISMFPQVKFVVLIFKLVIKSKVKFVHQKKANAILHF